MAILKVARLGHPVLRAKALPVRPGDIKTPRIQRLIDDMFETMAEYSGIGLAAPQVHESVRIFVAGVRDAEIMTPLTDEADMPLVALVNPEVVPVGDVVTTGWEGCLSIPDIRGQVPRPRHVQVRAFDRMGRRVEFEAEGLPARVIQHETDHLDGVIFFDRMRTLETLSFMDEFQRYWTNDDEKDDEHEGEGA